MTIMREVSLRDLEKRRAAILCEIGMTYEELADKAAAHALVGDEWAAWEEIREIDFLRKK
jgi:hypothetical protein